MEVIVQLLNDLAKLPHFSHRDDACADLYATEELSISPGSIALIGTGIALQLEPGWEAQIRPRSGMAAKHGMTIVNSPGTIDAGYRGEIKVILANLSQKVFEINIGDRIAQLAVRPIPKISFRQVVELNETIRSGNGLGSTGK